MRSNGRRQLILGGLIAGLGIWFGAGRLLGEAGPAHARADGSDSWSDEADALDRSTGGPVASEAVQRARRAQQDLADAAWPRNPFLRPLSERTQESDQEHADTPAEQPQFVLNAIVGGTAPLAMINGRTVAEGDVLSDGSTLTAIDAYSVTLRGPRGIWTLRLPD